METVRTKVKNFASTLGFQDMKVIILDECDYITPNVRLLFVTLWKHSRNIVDFILTCNYVERIIDPIQSRCQSFQIIPPDRKQVAVHLSNILQKEQVESDINDIATIVNGGYPDIRRVINATQRQVVDGELKIDEQAIIQNDYKLKILEFLSKPKKDAFVEIRKILSDNKVTDFADLFRLLYDEVDTYGKGHIGEIILILGQYQVSDSQVVDKEINAMAMLTEVLGVL